MLNAVVLLLLVMTIFGSSQSFASPSQACGDVSLARMNWPSAELISEVDKIVLSSGYGCEVSLVSGDTVQIMKSMMENRSPDVAPELWVDTLNPEAKGAIDEGSLIYAARVFKHGAVQGWWIPHYIADQYPDIRTVQDALERPDLFPSPDDDTVGAIHNCPAAWETCQIATTNLFNAHDAAGNGFRLIPSASAAELDGSIARAHKNETGWLGYYWSPTAVLGRYNMVKLDMGEHDPEHWLECTAIPDCESPRANAWPKNDVYSIVTREFAEHGGAPLDYLNKRQWNKSVMSELLAWIADNQASGEEAAIHFLNDYQQLWFPWVTEDAMINIRAALAAD